MPRKPSKKAIDKRVEKIYYQRCSGIQINIFDIGKVFAVGQASVAAGDNDHVLGDKIASYVQTIRKN